jgi:hypothetical protein
MARLCLICCVALALAPVYGQPGPLSVLYETLRWDAPGASATRPAAAPTQGTQRLYLPMLAYPAGPPATISFGTGQVGGQLVGEGRDFGFGIAALHYRVAVIGGSGRIFREEWFFDGVARPELTRSGVLPPGDAPYLSAIALSTGAPLPRGTYRLRLLVGGLVSGEAQAAIR